MKKSRIASLIVFVTVIAMLVCTMGVTVFAHEGEHTPAEAISEWAASTPGQIVGFCIAGVLLVAFVVLVILWIPKKNDKKDKKTTAKK